MESFLELDQSIANNNPLACILLHDDSVYIPRKGEANTLLIPCRAFLFLQPMFPPKPVDWSEGLDVFRFFFTYFLIHFFSCVSYEVYEGCWCSCMAISTIVYSITVGFSPVLYCWPNVTTIGESVLMPWRFFFVLFAADDPN